MSLDAVRIKAEQLAITALSAAHPGVKLRTQNVTFTQPNGEHWVDFKLSPGAEKAESLGENTLFRGWGVLNFTVLAPEGRGTKTALGIVETIKNTFRNRRFALGADGYVTFCEVTVRDRGTMNTFAAWGVMIEYKHSAS